MISFLTLYIFSNKRAMVSLFSISSFLTYFSAERFLSQKIRTRGDNPSPRAGHCAKLAADLSHLVVFGGYFEDDNDEGEETVYNDTFIFDLKGCTWKKMQISNPPRWAGVEFSFSNLIFLSPRKWHCSAMLNEYLYIFGGLLGTNVLNDLHRYNWQKNEWEEIYYNHVIPKPRFSAAMTKISDWELVVFGGATVSPSDDTQAKPFSDFLSFDTRNSEWNATMYDFFSIDPKYFHGVLLSPSLSSISQY